MTSIFKKLQQSRDLPAEGRTIAANERTVPDDPTVMEEMKKTVANCHTQNTRAIKMMIVIEIDKDDQKEEDAIAVSDDGVECVVA